ncbi:butyrate kinase [Clostridiaceae bacterium OttesenSCG-928-D20]|nr:butyrate kinase [Clostridiaceae bacterium OttesenSCG-928-D20]
MENLIFCINPGSTSTRVALFKGTEEVFKKNIAHSIDELEKFSSIHDQHSIRLEYILQTLSDHGYRPTDLSIVIGRGGMMPPLKAGGYIVNDEMLKLLIEDKIPQHASNLGCILAHEVAELGGIDAYIYDAVSVDEFPEIAKITGIPEIKRQSFCHVLNSKAVARIYAESIGKKYEEVNLVVAHLGGGISISSHVNGKIVDSQSDDAGPFAPERAGSIPSVYVIELCFSGQFDQRQMKKKFRGQGGLRALLGTSDCIEIEKRIKNGDEYAKLVYDAMAYQIAKGICLSFAPLMGEIDAVILTGSLSYSEYIVEKVKSYIHSFAPVIVIPGENEMDALAAGGLRILQGEKTHAL